MRTPTVTDSGIGMTQGGAQEARRAHRPVRHIAMTGRSGMGYSVRCDRSDLLDRGNPRRPPPERQTRGGRQESLRSPSYTSRTRSRTTSPSSARSSCSADASELEHDDTVRLEYL